ncbi:hypothetical protein ACMDCT_08210 [Halomonadaceae bacterium KBTZ08]
MMTCRLIVLGLVLALTGCGGGSDSDSTSDGADEPETLAEVIPACSGDPWQRVQATGIDAPPADSEAYVVPSSARRSHIQDAFQSFANTDYKGALAGASAAAYELCRSDSAAGTLVFWYPVNAGEGHARWAIRAQTDARPLVVESPHGFFETDTLTQAMEIFRELNARALLVNAGHRCANGTPSGCDGTTSVCSGSSEPFRESDMAHTLEAFFQVAHREIGALYPDTWVLNLHGMSREGISLSNGTQRATEQSSTVARFHGELAARFPDRSVTTCNAYGNTEATHHLCGTTNVQGRQRNDSPDACTQPAEAASGQFLHLEQNRSIRTDQARREQVIDALDAVLPTGGN